MTVATNGDGQGSGRPRIIERQIGDSETRVIIELRSPALVRRLRGGARQASKADRDAVALEHRRVRDEIGRLTGRPGSRSLGGAVGPEYSNVFNGLAASLSRDQQKALRAQPDVKAIHPDTVVHPVLDSSVAFVGAPAFWASHGGYRGAGRVIAVIDTGIDYTHPDLGACSAVGGGCKVIGGYDFHNNDADPDDDNGHGTHVAATAAGNGSLLGVAPDANLLAFKALSASGSGFTSNVIAAIEASVDPNGDNDTSDHADVANLSLGGPGDPDDPTSQAVDAATAAGVLVVASAGNSGGHLTIGSPGAARTALTVGAVDETPAVAAFTSGGPTTGTFEAKPEISAPGVSICAARAAATPPGPTCIDASHVAKNGTSMAAPHVAGAAALLRGIFPALAPADVKSLLVQNSSGELPDDVLKIGAGILDLPAASAAHSVVSPQTLSFGRVDQSQAIWTATRTLTIRNLDSSSRSYALSTSGFAGGLPVGATVAFTPASFSLGAGQSTTVTVQLTVDNSLVAERTSPPAYQEMVTIESGSETHRVPLIFLKTSLLRVHTDQLATAVLVHDRASRWQIVEPGRTTVDILVPTGTWDVVVSFPNGLGSYVVHEGIAVDGQRDEYVNTTEAIHAVSLTGTNEMGQPVNGHIRSWAVNHRASSLALATFNITPGGAFSITTNTISAAYDVDIAMMSLPAAKTYFIGKGVTGVTTSHALGNTAGELTRGAVVYHTAPGETASGRREALWYISASSIPVGFVLTGSLMPNHDVYVTPVPHGRYPYFLSSLPLIGGHEGPLYRGGTSTGVIESFNRFDIDNPVASTTTGELPINLGPASFFAKFTNSGNRIQLDWVAGSGNWTYHAQGGDGPSAPDGLAWFLSDREWGRVPQTAATVPTRTLPSDTFPPGFYTFETQPLHYSIDGLEATSWVEASFDTSRFPGDVNPPYLAGVTVRSGGALTDAVTNGQSATIQIRAHDAEDDAGMTLSLARIEGASVVPVPLAALGGGLFEALMLDACQAAGSVRLLIVATDSAGNELRQHLDPAFACRPATCGNGAIDPGETCDDGNLLPGDGCNSVCSGTEVCGDGAQDPGEECDDGNLIDGDCCSAGCQLDAAGTSCSSDGKPCSLDECDGTSTTCRHPAGNGGITCRARAGLCDAVDFCTGGSTECPDQFVPSGVPCRFSSGACDLADTCTGSSAACPDQFQPSGVPCRGSSGACDLADTCTGSSAACPDAKSTAVCRPASLPCDAAESCNGVSNSCPADQAAVSGVVCRPSTASCDAPETCDGISRSCPADGGVFDGDSDGACDLSDNCPADNNPDQADSDDDGDGDVCDPCTNGAVATKQLLRATKLALPTGDDKLTMKGEAIIPPSPPIDPLSNGVRFVLRGATRRTVLDVTVPGGAYDTLSKTGWKVNGAGTVWVFKGSGATTGGIKKVGIARKPAVPDTLKFNLKGTDGSWPVAAPDVPVTATLVLDVPIAAEGQCADARFPETPPAEPSCTLASDAATLKCK